MSNINFPRFYKIQKKCPVIKERATHFLGKYFGYTDLFTFNDADTSITYTTEKLIPTLHTNRPRVMLLFSNPHPLSVQQGMFLSPNTRGRKNLFWPVMDDAGWITGIQNVITPKELAEVCLDVEYEGPFEFIFYCYYTFPTNYPKDIRKIFGREYFENVIEPEAKNEFRQTIQETGVKAVVVFNKGIFNLVSTDPVNRYIDRLIGGEIIQSQVDGADLDVPIFLTFPTGWRYKKDFRRYRKESLIAIRDTISNQR